MTEEERKHRTLDCRVYKGEGSCPNNQNALIWDYERHWVTHPEVKWAEEIEDMHRLGLDKFTKNDDGTPLTLKAQLFNRYAHWVGLSDGGEGFVKWYQEFYLSIGKTNRQERYDHRKIKLIRRCRFYKGEHACPISDPKAEHFWKYEEIWVETLAKSYRNAVSWREELNRFPKIKNFAEDKSLPSSLIGLFVNRDEHWLGIIDEDEFIKGLMTYYIVD